MPAGNEATNRVALTADTHARLKQFRNGVDGSFDEAVNLLLDKLLKRGESEYELGLRLSNKAKK